MSQTPEQIPAEVREIADAIRANGDSPSAFAIGCIQARIDDKYLSDAEFRAKARTVLAALDLVLSPPPAPPVTRPRIDTEEAARAAFRLGHLEDDGDTPGGA